jgi:hypothetical protein
MPVENGRPRRKHKKPDEFSLNPSKVECICPKCGIRHIVTFEWTGRGTPRKFCLRCKN